MREKTRKIIIMIVMAALIVSLMAASFAALTYGRYSGGRRDENSAYEDILDLVGETAFEVSTADELVNAINNGYSYIKVVGDDPTLVVNNNVADVVVNLVLDVNGHKIVRNSRNPLLNVRQSVSVVLVYDSSKDAVGGFYNPVGSALQTSGGTLTVGAGVYESGPRTGIGLDLDTVSATVCSRDGRKAASYSVQETNQTFPKLTKKTGDVYLTTSNESNSYLKADTYLIYTEEENAFVRQGEETVGGTVLQNEQLYVNAKETSSGGTTTITADKFSPICDVASCDFYYYYPIGTAGTANSPQTYAVVYGYNDVKKLASNEKDAAKNLQDDGLVWPYAAIRSEAGNTHARGGEFYTYFGEENTHSIYSEGGTMTVGLSGESADAPTFQAIGKGVCINMAGTSGSADQTLTIENGEFSSKIGDTIKMSGGEMEVKKGSFTKDATVLGAASGDGASNGSAISISGGTLNMAGSEKDGAKSVSFTVTGNYVNGIRVQATTAAATATIKHAIFNFNEGGGSTNVAGIRSFGGDLTVNNTEFNISKGAASGEIKQAAGLSAEGGTVTAESCKFNFAQDASNVSPIESAGIYSSGGQVTATGCDFAIPGNKNYGIYSSITGEGAGEGYDTTATDCTFTMTGNSNHGIYAAGGKTLASGGTYTIGSEIGSGQTDNFGIQVSSGSVALVGVTLDVYGKKSSCVYAVGGTISLSGENAVNMHFSSTGTTISSTAISTEGGAIEVTGGSTSVSSDALGITARQNDGNEGSISIANGAAVTVGAENSPLHVTGVYVNGGKIENKGTLTVFSTIKDDLSWNENNKYNGVYVQGGSLVSEGTLNVTLTGVQNESHKSYDALKIRSYAVRVDEAAASGGKTEVSIAGGEISNSVGGGVYVGGGTVTLGVENGDGPTIGTTGVSFGDENTTAGGGNWKYYENKTGGHAVEVSGGDLLVYGGLYTAALGNGILVRDGNAWVLNGTFQGNDTETYRAKYGVGNLPAGPAAYYALKLLGGSVTTFGGTFGTYTADGTTHEAGGSSAFVTGVSSQATANIFGGTFVVNGQSGFSVYENVALEFTPNKEEKVNGQTLKGSDVTVSATTTAIAIENTTEQKVSVKINGGTFESTGTDDGKRDGIWYSNPYAKLTINQPDGQKTTISAKAQHGIRLVHAPVTKGGVKITGGTITGAQHGILYVDTTDNGKVAHVDDGLLIEGGTIEGKSGAGLYFAANPWQRPDNVATNNVAIVGGTFKGVPEEKSSTLIWENSWYDKGAIGSSTTGNRMDNRDGLGEEIKLNDILKTHTGDNRVGYVQNTGYNGNNGSSIADTVSSMTELTITSGIS